MRAFFVLWSPKDLGWRNHFIHAGIDKLAASLLQTPPRLHQIYATTTG